MNIESLINTYLNRPTSSKPDWFPLAMEAIEKEEDLVSSFVKLPLARKWMMLRMLEGPPADPQADIVLNALAQLAVNVQEEEIRQYLHDLASGAIERRAEMFAVVREGVEDAQKLKALEDAVELSRLEKEYQQVLRDRPDLDRALQLDFEVRLHRLRRRLLGSYDPDAGNRELERLKAEIEQINLERGPLEERIKEMSASEEGLRKDLTKLEVAARDQQGEVDALQESVRKAREIFTGLEGLLKQYSTDEERFTADFLMAVGSLCDRLEGSSRSGREELLRQRKRLQELENTVRMAGRNDLEAKIRELYGEFSVDESDRIVDTGRRP